MWRHASVRAVTPEHHLDAKGNAKYSFHSFRKFFATSLSRAKADRPRIQSMVRWLSDAAVDLYDKQSLDDQASYVNKAYHNAPPADIVTPDLLAQCPIDDNLIYLAWCEQCNVDIDTFVPDF
jgi:hypothetical protein